jgi:hypothetical protein
MRNGAGIGSITDSTNSVAYNTTSDERLKVFREEYDPAEAARIIKADPVHHFTWKSDGSEDIGWSAQRSYQVSPDLAAKPTKEDMPWMMDYGRRTPYLWAVVSDLLDRIEVLEAKIAELTARTN